MKHEVIAEFVDQETGERHVPAVKGGDPVLFEPRDDDQRQRLIAAGCLGSDEAFDLSTKAVEDMTRAELERLAVDAIRSEMGSASDDDLRAVVTRFRDKPTDDDGAGDGDGEDGDALTSKTVEQLKDIAAQEEVDLAGISKKAEIISAIEAKRAAAPAD